MLSQGFTQFFHSDHISNWYQTKLSEFSITICGISDRLYVWFSSEALESNLTYKVSKNVDFAFFINQNYTSFFSTTLQYLTKHFLEIVPLGICYRIYIWIWLSFFTFKEYKKVMYVSLPWHIPNILILAVKCFRVMCLLNRHL